MTPPVAGDHPLTGAALLPNASVAFGGEHWSDGKAAGPITIGAPVIPAAGTLASAIASAQAADTPGNARTLKQVEAADTIADERQVAIALRTVVPPYEQSVTDGYLADNGPNEIVNRPLARGEYVHEYRSGAFNLTLVEPRSDYVPGQIIGWNPAATRPVGKRGATNDETGAWTNTSRKANTNLFEIREVHKIGAGDEVLLMVSSLRGQF
jgi:hypothetical protein